MEKDEQTNKRFSNRDKYSDATLLILGSVLLMSEIWKQWYLYTIVFDHHYRVWYFPFQLCSMPMYLCIVRFFLIKGKRKKNLIQAIDTFLQNFAMLGGIAALMVPDGFTHPDHSLLTLHGYVWHVLLITIAVIIYVSNIKNHFEQNRHIAQSSHSIKAVWKQETKRFIGSIKLLFLFCAIAEVINVILHPYGDCDMFYISPYHLSSQPVFHDIDASIGRGWGILIYIFAVIIGAFLIHLLYLMLDVFVQKILSQQKNAFES